MCRFFTVILLFGVLSATAQKKETVLRMKDSSSPFLETYVPNQLIRIEDTACIFELTHEVIVGQSMQTVFDSLWYRAICGAAEIDPIYADDSAKIVWFNDTLLVIGTKENIDSLAEELQDSLSHRLSNRIYPSAIPSDSFMYFNYATQLAEMRHVTQSIPGDSLAWVYDPVNHLVRLRVITDSVAIGTYTPTTELTIANNVNYIPVVYDSTDIDAGGITVSQMSRVIIYEDTNDCWFDWAYGSGAEIAAGQEGQLITIFSVSTGKLFLKNNEPTNTVVFEMYMGDNVTIQYVDTTWIEVAREDFSPYTAGGGGVTAGVSYVAATAGTGISISGSPITSSGTLVITNTLPDQTVTITDAGGVTVTGTYPDFSLAVTSPFYDAVGIWPVVVTGTSTPTISMAAASATSDGYLDSLDWNTFNAKMNNPLTTTGDLIYSSSGTTASRLAIGTNNQVLLSNGSTPYWQSGVFHDSVTIGTPPNGLSQISQEISMALASETDTGALSSADWKRFDTLISAVTATSPLFSSGGSTPNITIQQSSTATEGSLSAANFNIFNNKIGGSGTISYIPKFTAVRTLANSIILDNGTYIQIGTSYTTNYKLDVVGSVKGRYKLYLDGAATGSALINMKAGTADSVVWEHTATPTNYAIGMDTDGTDPPPAITIDSSNLIRIASRTQSYYLPISAGTSGQVLTSNGNADTLSWSTNLSPMYRYTALTLGANNVEVLATYTGITATLGGGIITFTIPSGVKIISAKIRVDGVSTITIDMGTVDMANSTASDRWMPTVQAWREDTGQQLMGMTTLMDLVTFSKFNIYGLINSTKCLIKLNF